MRVENLDLSLQLLDLAIQAESHPRIFGRFGLRTLTHILILHILVDELVFQLIHFEQQLLILPLKFQHLGRQFLHLLFVLYYFVFATPLDRFDTLFELLILALALIVLVGELKILQF